MEATMFTGWIYVHLKTPASINSEPILISRSATLLHLPHPQVAGAQSASRALTGALEMGDVQRFSSIKKPSAIAGCAAERSSGNTVQRTSLSKQRNKHLQTTLIEAAKMAPRNSPNLALVYERE
jgi:hypothetical protein